MPFYADGHVHLHPGFDLGRLARVLAGRSRELGGDLLLLLAETPGASFFRGLRRAATSPSEGSTTGRGAGGLAALRPQATDEPESLRLLPDSSPAVFAVAGRQFVSRERLEVLGLGLDPDLPLRDRPDGEQEAEALVEAVLGAGGIAVLPWGVGKWTGARGRLVRQLARAFSGEARFLAGDIAHRPVGWPVPRAFREAAGPVLAGTDPLPLPGLEAGIARYGTRFEAPFRREAPAASLRAALEAGAAARPFGRRDGPMRVFREQLRYRLDRARR